MLSYYMPYKVHSNQYRKPDNIRKIIHKIHPNSGNIWADIKKPDLELLHDLFEKLKGSQKFL